MRAKYSERERERRERDKESERTALRNDARGCLSMRDALDAFSLGMNWLPFTNMVKYHPEK